METAGLQKASFIGLLILVTIAFIWLILPFYGALLWAVILAILFNPLNRRLERGLNGRRSLAAALSLLACICIVVIPGSLILSMLAREAVGLYDRISTREFDPARILEQLRGAAPGFVLEWFDALDLQGFDELQARFTSFLGQAAQAIASRMVVIGQNTAQFVISLAVMVYVLFFLFRDGEGVVRRIREASPLSRRHTDHVLRKFSDVVRATVKGNAVIAIVQGSIGGLAFWAVGIEGALLWGVVMTLLSLLPAVGAFLVWAPAVIYLMISGAWLKAGILLAIGGFISIVDNLLRPTLVGKGTRLSDYMVLVSTLGGLALIGMNGFVIGPLIAALFVSVWSLSAEERALNEPQPQPPEPRP
ncbi:AI-2E family transporter [Neomegalonema sp.]|uniref:AI-2E family transporter n=1 Tax=Neomegalonema sp. TaxID=2039713 RepID=UPI00263171AB|nr:AI-2E family transporter [Neomegalonema sp.]MDD2869725.1 AI-2E family transporter [Neomegalonema sp.]